MNTTTGGLGWMYDRDLPLVGLTFARQINAREVLERMGGDQNTVAVRGPDDFRYELGGLRYASDGYVVSAGHYRSWAWTWDVPLIDSRRALGLPSRRKPLCHPRFRGQAFRGLSDGAVISISSVALENAIMSHPEVIEAAVIGVPDEKWEERPLVSVVRTPEAKATAHDLRDFLATKVARWQLPERWVFIDEIPKTSVGKFDKIRLRKLYAEGSLSE